MPDRVLLIAGAVALGDTPRARQWAHLKIAETMAWLLDGDAPLLVHGGCTDPQRAHPRDNVDWWADAIARARSALAATQTWRRSATRASPSGVASFCFQTIERAMASGVPRLMVLPFDPARLAAAAARVPKALAASPKRLATSLATSSTAAAVAGAAAASRSTAAAT
mgnify:CR=1 FL=1